MHSKADCFGYFGRIPLLFFVVLVRVPLDESRRMPPIKINFEKVTSAEVEKKKWPKNITMTIGFATLGVVQLEIVDKRHVYGYRFLKKIGICILLDHHLQF